METAIISIICIALVVFGGMTMSQGFMTSVDASTTGLEEVGQRDETIMRTELTTISATMSDNDTLEMILENTGSTKLADFEKWDVIVQYYDSGSAYYTTWLPYTSGTPSANKWTVAWIHLNGAAEIFEQNILNPGEQVMIQAELSPAVGAGSTNMVIAATPNGIPVSAHFSP
jgi:hypothetical protein